MEDGDIIMSEQMKNKLKITKFFRGFVRDLALIWMDKVVPYEIDSSIQSKRPQANEQAPVARKVNRAIQRIKLMQLSNKCYPLDRTTYPVDSAIHLSYPRNRQTINHINQSIN